MLLQKDPHITQGDPVIIDREILTSERSLLLQRDPHITQGDPVIIDREILTSERSCYYIESLTSHREILLL